jgi:hypothetical protein
VAPAAHRDLEPLGSSDAIALETSSAIAHCAMTAGWRSISPFQTLRAVRSR